MDLSFVHNDSTHAAGGDDVYPATPDSTPLGGGSTAGGVTPVGVPSNTTAGFYAQRGDMVGRTDTVYNVLPNSPAQSGANWYSAGDNAPVFNSTSGLGGPVDDDGPVWTAGTRFSDTLSQSSLAGGGNPDTPYGH